jgi:hypothetical protein
MGSFKCPVVNCGVSFTRNSNLTRHHQRFHLQSVIVEKCVLCGLIFPSCNELQSHYKRFHKPSKYFYVKESAFQKAVMTYRFNYEDGFNDFQKSQTSLLPSIKKTIYSESGQRTICKVGLIIIAEMQMIDHVGDKITTAVIPFRAQYFMANASNKISIARNIRKSFRQQNANMEEFCNSGSNWVYVRSVAFDIEIASVKPILIGGSSSDGKYLAYEQGQVCLKNVKNNKFLFNPKNEDEKCFLYCVVQFLYGEKLKEPNKSREYLKYFKTFDLSNLSFPISIQDIKKFLSQNKKLNLKINILLLDRELVFPYEYGLGKGKKIMTLLMVHKKVSEDNSNNHFVLVKNPNKFLRNIYENDINKKSYQHSLFCLNCMNRFYLKSKLEQHQEICSMNKAKIEECPEEGKNKLFFKNYPNCFPLEYISYLDFECILPKNTENCTDCNSLRCKCDKSFTKIETSQHPISYCFIVLDSKNNILHEKVYSGPDAADHFIEHLLNQNDLWITNMLNQKEPMKMTVKDLTSFENATNCYMCDVSFSNGKSVKCRDHDHTSGKYIGAACGYCNIRRTLPAKLPIFIHNGSR